MLRNEFRNELRNELVCSVTTFAAFTLKALHRQGKLVNQIKNNKSKKETKLNMQVQR